MQSRRSTPWSTIWSAASSSAAGLRERIARAGAHRRDHLAMLRAEVSRPTNRARSSRSSARGLRRQSAQSMNSGSSSGCSISRPSKTAPTPFSSRDFALDIEDAEAAQPGLRHAADEMALAHARAAADGHDQPLLPRTAAERINSRSLRVAHLFCLLRAASGI